MSYLMADSSVRADRVTVERLSILTVVGVFGEERKQPQEVILHLDLETDARRAALRDDLEHALDYAAVARRVTAVVGDSRFHLIETLAERVAEVLLAEFPTPRVTVRVEKPGALHEAKTVAITITRERPSV